MILLNRRWHYVKSFGYVEDENYDKAICAQQTEQQEQKRKFMHHSVRKVSQKRRLNKVMEECYEMEEERGAIQKILEKKRFCAEKGDRSRKSEDLRVSAKKRFPLRGHPSSNTSF